MSNTLDDIILDEFYLDLQSDGLSIRELTEEDIKRMPFPGLRPFKTSENRLFKGRDGQADELVDRLEQAHFLAVIGSSGTGKSSLVRAGLIPRLFDGALYNASDKWNIAMCRPGTSPVRNLATALACVKARTTKKGNLLPELDQMEEALMKSVFGLLDINKQLQSRDGNDSNLLIIVDQFEELVRFNRASAGTVNADRHFVELLLNATAQNEYKVYVIITMRSEFLGDCVRYRGLPEAINKGQYLVPQLERKHLIQVIEQPIRSAGKTITSGLVELLVNEIENEKLKENLDQLPILQHALMRTYNFAQKCRPPATEICYDHYEATGGMRNALANHANSIYGDLKENEKKQPKLQEIAKIVFQALTEYDMDGKGGRRPVKLGIILDICSSICVIEEDVYLVINKFRDSDTSFIMPPISTSLSNKVTLDISHESLVRNWHELEDWAKEEATDGKLYKMLNERRILNDRDKDQWVKGVLLNELRAWRKKEYHKEHWASRYHEKSEIDGLTDKETYDKNVTFLEESEIEEEREEKEKAERQQREIDDRQKQIDTEKRRAEIEKNLKEIAEDALNKAERERYNADRERMNAEVARMTAEIEKDNANKLSKNLKKSLSIVGGLVVVLIVAGFLLAYSNKQTKNQRNNYMKTLSKVLIINAEKAYNNLNDRLAFQLVHYADSLDSSKHYTDSLLNKWKLMEYSGTTVYQGDSGRTIYCLYKDHRLQVFSYSDDYLNRKVYTFDSVINFEVIEDKYLSLQKEEYGVGGYQKPTLHDVYSFSKRNDSLKYIAVIRNRKLGDHIHPYSNLFAYISNGSLYCVGQDTIFETRLPQMNYIYQVYDYYVSNNRLYFCIFHALNSNKYSNSIYIFNGKIVKTYRKNINSSYILNNKMFFLDNQDACFYMSDGDNTSKLFCMPKNILHFNVLTFYERFSIFNYENSRANQIDKIDKNGVKNVLRLPLTTSFTFLEGSDNEIVLGDSTDIVLHNTETNVSRKLRIKYTDKIYHKFLEAALVDNGSICLRLPSASFDTVSSFVYDLKKDSCIYRDNASIYPVFNGFFRISFVSGKNNKNGLIKIDHPNTENYWHKFYGPLSDGDKNENGLKQ